MPLIKGALIKGIVMNEKLFFLDSGAYSIATKKINIDIKEYIAYIKQYKEYITYYSVLDAIGSAEQTYKNQKIMEKAGLKPIPCFHYGEDPKWLIEYINNYKYISIGGLVRTPKRKRKDWLDHIFSKYICNVGGLPKVKVHGFGITDIESLLRYPWYSVDSTSWLLVSRFGRILVPYPKKDGFYDYKKTPISINISTILGKPNKYNYQNGITPTLKKHVDSYLKKIGFEVGKSYIDENGIEVIEKEGISNNYKLRDLSNIRFFTDLEKNLPKWPWRFSIDKRVKRFSL